jgi:RimJ/RimL family protein N-acetyltransferase
LNIFLWNFKLDDYERLLDLPRVTHPPNTIKTARLRLRKVESSDAEAIHRQYARDPEVTRYVSWRAHRSLNETREYVRMCLLAWDVGNAYHWAIERSEDKQVIGMMIARVNSEKWELGFVLARAHWGKGYMTEAVREIVAWALKQKDIYRVWAVCDIDNLASARVMEKAGMQREGILRRWSVHPNISPEPRDSYCYAIVK